MRKVAERVGVSATAIYRHFADRNALVAAAQEDAGQQLAQYFARALAGKTPRERLHLTGRNYLRFALEHQKYYQVLFMAWDELPVDLPSPRHGGGYAPTFQFLLDRVGECVLARLLPPRTDVFEVAMLCWSVCHGLASLYLTGPARRRMAEREFLRLADRVLARTLNGLLDGSRSRRTPSVQNRVRRRAGDRAGVS